MTLDPERTAKRLRATHFNEAPKTDGSAFGMAYLAEALKQRLDARGGREKGSAVGWVLSSKVPMSADTERRLIALAEKLSTAERRVNPLDLAAQLLEDSVNKLTNENAK